VKICQIEPEAVLFLRDEMGLGTITLNGARLSRPNSSPIYQWGIRNREEVLKFLESVIPYLRIKRLRAMFLLDYCKTAVNLKDRGTRYFGLPKDELVYREESYQKMRELNGRKVAATTKPQKHESVSDSLNF
jgi:hypothetical protein